MGCQLGEVVIGKRGIADIAGVYGFNDGQHTRRTVIAEDWTVQLRRRIAIDIRVGGGGGVRRFEC